MSDEKVVLRFLDGKIIKGHIRDFSERSEELILQELDSDDVRVMKIDILKAIFFVKTFEGNPNHSERKSFVEGDKLHGRKVEVTFVDGEVLQGSTMGYDPKRPGFFLFPPDPEGSNIRVFVVSSAVKKFRYL